LEDKQQAFDQLLAKDLALAKKILEREQAKRAAPPEAKGEPMGASAPPDPKGNATPAKQESPANADPKTPAAKKEQRDASDQGSPFAPALTADGERNKPDPRTEKKLTYPPRKADADRREALREHQKDNLEQLDSAQKALEADEQTLEQMIKALLNAAEQAQANQTPMGNATGDALRKMLQSNALKNARQMAQRAKQSQTGAASGQANQQPPPGTSSSTDGNALGLPGSLAEFDPQTRATILQLPPRLREELLQGMKAQGPAGYQKFIQDYFRRLANTAK
jgi:hypothetical protein